MLSEEEIRLKEKELELKERELNQNVIPVSNDNSGVAGLICGILSFGGIFIPIFGVVMSIIALGIGASTKDDSKNKMPAIILGVIGLVVSIIAWVIWAGILINR